MSHPRLPVFKPENEIKKYGYEKVSLRLADGCLLHVSRMRWMELLNQIVYSRIHENRKPEMLRKNIRTGKKNPKIGPKT
jgi:hypothetical protein